MRRPRPINWAAIIPSPRERRAERLCAAARLLAVAILIAALFGLAACGFNGLGPETLILAETPCGRIEYRSSKDQTAPGAVCRIGPDGAAYLEMGADASSGSGAVARAVAEGIVKGIGAAR